MKSITSAMARSYYYLRSFDSLRWLGRNALKVPGLRSIVRSSVNTALSTGGNRQWYTTPYGELKFDAQWEDSYLIGLPEKDTCEQLLHHLKPGMCFYDIGGHVGFYMLMGKKLVGASGRVYCFEPDPTNAQDCRDVIAKNHLAQVEIVQAAVYRSKARMRFELGVGSRMSGHISGVGCDSLDRGETVDIQAISIDDFVQDHEPPDLMKIDVEGGEVEVLQGAAQTIRTHRPIILVETHRPEFHTSVEEILTSFGYTYRNVSGRTKVPMHLLAIAREATSGH